MKPSSKILALAVRTFFGLVLLAAGIGIAVYLVATKPEVSKSSIDAQPVRVQVVRVEPIDVARQWRGYGTTQAKATADVPARVGATVIEVPDSIEVGTIVAKGDVLAKLDGTDFRNALNIAQQRIAETDALIDQLTVERKRLEQRLEIERRDLKLAQDDFNRQDERLSTGSTTQADLDRSQRTLLAAQRAVLATRQQLDSIPPRLAGLEATRAAAQADRDNARSNLERTTIVSPIDGIVESLDVEVGENLAPGARVARVIDPRIIELPLQLPASARSYVKQGDKAVITTRNMPDDCPPWTAQISRLSAGNSSTRTFTAFAEIDQSQIPLRQFAQGGGEHRLTSGAFAMATLDTAEPVRRIIIPARAIQEGRIRTVVDGQIVGRTVDVIFDLENTYEQFGLPDTQWVVLRDTLEPGELVVLNAATTILDGQPVDAIISNDRAQNQRNAKPPATANALPDDEATP